MTHQYQLKGLTCSSCVAKVKHALLLLPEVLSAEVTQDSAIISMDTHIPTARLQEAISHNGKYSITELQPAAPHATTEESTLKTYKPLLLTGLFITGVSFLAANGHGGFDPMMWMNFFMAGFFIAFSFFKLLDLRAFADSYSMYDVLAKKWKGYGYIYPFLELALGIAFITGFNPVFTNAATVVIMGFSSIGVIQSVMNKKQIRCACLGAVFNLPMSTVTIVEDGIMIAMATASLLLL